MRVILAGTRSFGAAVLGALKAHEVTVVAVIAPPGDKLATAAARLALSVVERPTEGLVQATGADLLIAAHSHAFIGARTRRALRLGAIGYHPSLLPRHRGRDAVRWTVHMRDPVAGGTVYWLTDHVDGGPIAAQDWCWVKPKVDAHQLWQDELFPMGVRLIVEAVDRLECGVMTQIPQDESVATWEPSFGSPPLFRPELPEIGPLPNGVHKLVNSR